jgi:hypothetical protein
MKLVRSILLAVIIVTAACTSIPREPAVLDLTGEWLLTTTSQMGAQDATMMVQQTGKGFSGKVSSPQGVVDYSGVLQGEAVRFSFMLEAGAQPLKIEYSGVVAGDTMSGKAEFGPFGAGTFSAKRKRD